jgi:hypothetical protein
MRLVSDPNALVLFATCISADMPTRTFPAGCDWFDIPTPPGSGGVSLSIESVAPSIQLVVVLILFAWVVRRSGGLTVMSIGMSAAAIIGSVLLIGASTLRLSFLDAPAIALLGIAWLGAARLVPARRLAVLTGVLGIAALLEAVDNGIVMLPLPLGVVWIRVLLELVWIGWIVILMVRSPLRGRDGAVSRR